MIFHATYFRPHSLAYVTHSIYSFIIIAINVGSSFRAPIVITFHHIFPSQMKKTRIYRACSSANTCQYKKFHAHWNKIRFLCVDILYCITTESYWYGKWVSDLVQFSVGHTHSPLVLVLWKITIILFCR